MWFIVLWSHNSLYSRWLEENNFELLIVMLYFKNNGILNTTSEFSVIDVNQSVNHMEEVNGLQLYGILGVDFLTNNTLIIDFDKLQITY